MSARAPRRALVACAAALALLCLLSPARAQTVQPSQLPITACSVINPNPTVTQCSDYPAPAVDLLGALDYDSVPTYRACVEKRCVCTMAVPSDNDFTANPTSGYFCSAAGVFDETSTISCNKFGDCLEEYWKCVGDALMDRRDAGATLTAAETAMVTDIISHGITPGQSFHVTDMYKSCRMISCEATAARKYCGLQTCLLNYTQCYEYIKPPPIPHKHVICTQGCRAVLLLMALTLTIVSMCFCCCVCCPMRVRKDPPLVEEDSDEDSIDAEKRRLVAQENASGHSGEDEDGTSTGHNNGADNSRN